MSPAKDKRPETDLRRISEIVTRRRIRIANLCMGSESGIRNLDLTGLVRMSMNPDTSWDWIESMFSSGLPKTAARRYRIFLTDPPGSCLNESDEIFGITEGSGYSTFFGIIAGVRTKDVDCFIRLRSNFRSVSDCRYEYGKDSILPASQTVRLVWIGPSSRVR